MTNRHRFDRAVGHACWLGELAAALDQASKLTLRLLDFDGDKGEAAVLRARIRSLSTEVASIRRGPGNFHPNRME